MSYLSRKIIREWTPEILQKVRENCIWRANQDHAHVNISDSVSNWIGITNYKLAVRRLHETHPDFPRKKYERKKLAFTDKEYLELRNIAKKKNLSSEIIQEFDNRFYDAFAYCYRCVVNDTGAGTLAGFGFDANILGYLELAYYIHWVKADSNKPQVYNVENDLLSNQSTDLPDNALIQLGICKKEKNLE